MPERSPFRTWNGIQAYEFVDGVRLHAIGGDQVLLCRVSYEPGKQVTRHAHELGQVLDATLRLDGAVGFELGEIARVLEDGFRPVALEHGLRLASACRETVESSTAG